MSGKVRNRRKGTFVADGPMTKAEKRAAAKQARAKAAAAARRRRLLGISAAWLAGALAVAAVVFWWVRRDDDGGSSAEPTASPTVTSTAFPPLPAGADPALGTKPAVTAGTGDLTELKVTPIVDGTGPAVQNGQKVTVNYVGVSYKTGEEFDSSWKRSQTFDIDPIGQGKVIKGWDQGLVGVKVGSRVQLDIPSNLAYGDDASSGNPTGPLRFVVDVLAVQ